MVQVLFWPEGYPMIMQLQDLMGTVADEVSKRIVLCCLGYV